MPASGRPRSSIGSAASWIARDMLGSRVISPFFSRAFRWQTTPLGDWMPKLSGDLADRWAVAAAANLLADELVHLLLPLRQLVEQSHACSFAIAIWVMPPDHSLHSIIYACTESRGRSQGQSVFHNAQELEEFAGAIAEIAEGDGDFFAAGQTQQTDGRVAKGG